MATIEPSAAALNALVTWLTTQLGANVSAVRRGWPEASTKLDLTGKPVLAITAGPEIREGCAPKHIGAVTAAGVTTYTYRMAYLAIPIQLDVWASHRSKLDAIGPLLRAAMQTPPLAGLRLTSTDYYDRPITVEMDGAAFDHDGDTAPSGEWRRTYTAEAITDEVATTTHPKQVLVTGEFTIDDVAEPAVTLLP